MASEAIGRAVDEITATDVGDRTAGVFITKPAFDEDEMEAAAVGVVATAAIIPLPLLTDVTAETFVLLLLLA